MTTMKVTVSGSPATVRGLSPGNWSFTVSAVDAAGAGAQSAPSDPVAVTGSTASSRVLTVDRGAWSSTSPYAWDDSVNAGGATWYCVSQTGVLGVAPGTDPTRWGTAVA